MKKTYQSPLFDIDFVLVKDVMSVSIYGDDNVGLLPDDYWGGALDEYNN